MEGPNELRILMVDIQVLIDFLKGPGDRRRTYNVANALPADAHVFRMSVNPRESGVLECVIGSHEWGDTPEGTITPTVFVNYPLALEEATQ